MRDLLADLNPDQQRVVQAVHGPVLVLAGAGSGKTRALTHRIAYIIAKGEARPEEILAVTFTNKAAAEMRERVHQLLQGRSAPPSAIGTFHAIGARMLRQQAQFLSRSQQFMILDSGDSERIVRRTLDDLSYSRTQFHPRKLKAFISRAKGDSLSPQDTAAQAGSTFEDVAARVYARYEELLQQEDAYDFDDLLREPVRLLEREQRIRDTLRARWRFVSVDEYQDTNPMQDRLLELLLGNEQNICVVGDDYQAIYSWRGARVDHILEFPLKYPHCTTVYLTRNYRSTPAILAAANAVIAANVEQMHKELWTEKQPGTAVRAVSLPSGQAEAAWVRKELEHYTQAGGRLRECVVLYRTNAQSRAFEEEFLTNRLPYTIVGGFRFYERREVKDALALLQLASGSGGRLAVQRLADALWRGVGPKTLQTWQIRLSKKGAAAGGWLEVLQTEASRRPVIRPAAVALRAAGARTWETVGDLLSFLLTQSGYVRSVARLADGEERQENLDELINVASGYADSHRFLEEAALLSDIDTLDAAQDRVTCMTLHAAKGLEFPVVFLTGCEEGLLPHENSVGSLREIEEERRLLYVGMTRAQEQLTLSYAASRYLHGTSSFRTPSRFLKNLPVEVVRTEPAVLTPSDEWVVEADDLLWTGEATNNFAVGDFVLHPGFGRGVVIGAAGTRVTCVFDGHGVKTVASEQVSEPAE
ncbi:MAG: hypothetical protein COT71_02745 [Candidatus Andersenbacteria bacterium CG10_big_fil_rev_8_21_14_0_10_54_11]|uniref:DNA 3'-5' helicase n=1 Tax=Candidatus Andersenbacteria bacterium CG10_big_fil_rev_8_21_14_0_10_54_11 TaxID=1974485 RepID=A0A2M6WZ28_9BACT|nr:MAG: hypothetical protein COT71_02745 [Candidatus Andersenbacteria bacterium CG10_big_fil_rev_8_21_14_0_10_54_11]